MATPHSPMLSPSEVAPRISVALATYNGQLHLQEQLDSLARQTLLPFELVVTDDGSTDSTLALVQSFAKSAPFPVYLHSNQDRLGYGDNFLHAASLCSGDLIAFCDQDDYWLAEKLATCAHFFEDRDTSLVIHSAETWDGHARLGCLYPFHQRTEITPPGITDLLELTPGFSVVFRRSLLTLVNNEDRPGCLFGLSNGSVMAHDAWIRLVGASTGKTAKLSDVLALYRQHGSNTVGAPSRRGLRRRLQLAAQNFNYALLADFEAKCCEVLLNISEAAAPAYAEERRFIAEHFRQRAKLHRIRDTLYGSTATFVGRVESFLSLLTSGAYSFGEKLESFGPRAAVKDLSFGVSGLYKHLT